MAYIHTSTYPPFTQGKYLNLAVKVHNPKNATVAKLNRHNKTVGALPDAGLMVVLPPSVTFVSGKTTPRIKNHTAAQPVVAGSTVYFWNGPIRRAGGARNYRLTLKVGTSAPAGPLVFTATSFQNASPTPSCLTSRNVTVRRGRGYVSGIRICLIL